MNKEKKFKTRWKLSSEYISINFDKIFNTIERCRLFMHSYLGTFLEVRLDNVASGVNTWTIF